MREYTVVFFVDAAYGVEGFSQHVTVADVADAFDAAVAQAKADGGTSSGRTIRDHEWTNATEIVTFAGHCQSAYSISAPAPVPA